MSEKIQYQVRIPVDAVKKFKRQCEKFKRYHYDVARELLTAYAEGRVTIVLTPEQEEERKLYHES